MAEPAAYRRVADAIRAAIERGELEPGARMQTIQEIADTHGVSKETATRAVRLLVGEGLITSTRSRGIYVRERPRERAIVRDRHVYRDEIGYYFDQSAKDWRAIGVPRRGQAVPPAHVAGLLGVPPGEAVFMRDRAMGPAGATTASQLATSYLPLSLVSELPIVGKEQTGHGGIYDRIEEHFNAPLEWHETISARPANDEEVFRLGVAEGLSVLVVTREARIHRGNDVVVAEVNETRMSAEQFAVSYAVQRDVTAAWPVEAA